MATDVVVPWRPGCPHRERAWEWCRPRYQWAVIEAPGPELWSKGAAAMPAIERSCADIVVVADADVWTDGFQQAIEAVEDGAPWAIPHGKVRRLDRDATAVVLAGAEPTQEMALAERSYPGVMGGAIVVARRDVLLDVPLDPRFVGWGQEDASWALALRCLAGKPWRGDATLWHLWHPPQERLSRARGSVEGWRLYRRYRQARYDRTAMRTLVKEAKDALESDQQAVHDRSTVGV